MHALSRVFFLLIAASRSYGSLAVEACIAPVDSYRLSPTFAQVSTSPEAVAAAWQPANSSYWTYFHARLWKDRTRDPLGQGRPDRVRSPSGPDGREGRGGI